MNLRKDLPKIVAILLVLCSISYLLFKYAEGSETDGQSGVDDVSVVQDPTVNENPSGFLPTEEIYQFQGELVDVVSGLSVSSRRGLLVGLGASGTAKYLFENEYMLSVVFKDLQDPLKDDFYEGWLVRQSPFAYISTGRIDEYEGDYTNGFKSDVDYSDYDFYVLTIEPNDGNPAPAGHVLEGYMRDTL